MKGFLIEIHNNKISAAVDRGIVVITANTANISITGRDIATGMSLNWGKLILRKGDKIKIIASEIEKSTVPYHSDPLSRKELLTEYYQLKELLTKEGYLK
jgi:hypothetical protein